MTIKVHPLSECIIISFEISLHASKPHVTNNLLGITFKLPASVCWCTLFANHLQQNSAIKYIQTILGTCMYLVHSPGKKTLSVFISSRGFLLDPSNVTYKSLLEKTNLPSISLIHLIVRFHSSIHSYVKQQSIETWTLRVNF